MITLTNVARATITRAILSSEIGKIIEPTNIITATYLRYPFSESEILEEIYKHLETMQVGRKKIVKQDCQYIVVEADKPISKTKVAAKPKTKKELTSKLLHVSGDYRINFGKSFY